MTKSIQRDATELARARVHELARAAVGDGLDPQERVARARLAADASRVVQALGPLLDPYRGTDHSRFQDALTIGRGQDADGEAAARLGLHRQAQLTLNRETQNPADNPGILPPTLAAPSATPVVVTPFLDALAVTVSDLGQVLQIPQAWDPVPMGTINSPDGIPPAPVSSTMGMIDVPTVPAAAWVNVSSQVLKWGTRALVEFDWVLDAAVSSALEQALLAELTEAAGNQVTVTGDLADALDQAEQALTWYTGPTHIVCNPFDWPTIRRAWASVGFWPVPLTPIVTHAQTVGTALMFPAGAVEVEVSPTEWGSVKEPAQVGSKLGAYRDGAAGSRSPGALSAITLATTPPAALTSGRKAGSARD